MFDTLSILPFSFWVAMAVLVGGAVFATRCLGDGSGLPMLIVLGTVGAWYVGDVLYNDYPDYHAKLFEPQILGATWWEVACFLAVFLFVTPAVHRLINGRNLQRGSGVLRIVRFGINQPQLQRRMKPVFLGCILIWLALAVIAAIRVKGEFLYYVFPFLGHNASPWARDRIGAGFDALLILAYYLQQMVAGGFGVVAAISTHRRTLYAALFCCLLSWPYFIFDRTRNAMLAVVIPGLLAWVFLRMRGGIVKKGAVLAACYLLINAWMGFVIANRSTSNVGVALREQGFSLKSSEQVHHEGLNMYEELCWINTFIDQGIYTPNWGRRYFAELVNPIPRSLWPGKPLIGIDYAVLRGQAGGDKSGAGVYATISTGMIGQGVVNFGRILGPAFAALLMSFWVACLARLDLHIQELGRLPLYGLGLILTFNLGRDITLITLYPFVFGALLVWYFDRHHKRDEQALGRERRRMGPPAAGGHARLTTAPATPMPGLIPMRAGLVRKSASFARQPKSFPFGKKRFLTK